MKPIPEQYKEQAEALIYKIGKLSNKLWAFVSELGDSLEIECEGCVIILTKKELEGKDEKT